MALIVSITNSLMQATTYYWIGGVGTSAAPKSWNLVTNWSTTSGGSGDGVVPGSGDIAVFDASTNNVSPFVDVNGLTINITQLQISQGASAHNVVAFVNTSSSFSISGNLVINRTATYYGQISDYGNNTLTVGGNIVSNATANTTLVTVPTTNSNSKAGTIALTGSNPYIHTPHVNAIATANLSGGGTVSSLTLVSGGASYGTTAPTVTISAPPSGTTATATAILTGGIVTGFTITNAGSG